MLFHLIYLCSHRLIRLPKDDNIILQHTADTIWYIAQRRAIIRVTCLFYLDHPFRFHNTRPVFTLLVDLINSFSVIAISLFVLDIHVLIFLEGGVKMNMEF